MELTQDPDVRRAYSRDASGLELVPECVARPVTAAEVADVVEDAIATNRCVTAAGSQTSMTGGSITDDGILLSVKGMKRILDIDPVARIARVEPGVTIGDLNRALAGTYLHFAPDPTSENDATVGGAIACNASGARSLRHGPTRRHVRGLTVVGADAATTYAARTALEKNTVGFSAVQDPVDWYVGSEGTLGIIVEAELSLVPLPVNLVGLAIPFDSEAAALAFVVAARETAARSAHCLEYFDESALSIAGVSSARPWGAEARAMVYLEDDAGEDTADTLLDAWLAIAEASDAIVGEIRVFEGSQAFREARAMRHAVPSTMNERGDRFRAGGGRKVSTDWAVPYRLLARALELSDAAVKRHDAPRPITYGHAGNGHPHQNFIAEDAEALARVNAAVNDTVRSVLDMGGTISAEHGLGKLKRKWLSVQLSESQAIVMRAMKTALDPRGMFGPGTLF